MRDRLALLLGVSLVTLASCANKARLLDESGGSGSGGDSSGTSGATGSGSDGQQSTGASGSGTTNGSATATQDTETLGLGVRGIAIFDPVPEFNDASVLRVDLLRGVIGTEDESPVIANLVEQVGGSPVPFFVALDPAECIEDFYYYFNVHGDMDGDGEYSCGDYKQIVVDGVDPADPEHVHEVTLPFMDGFCP